MVKRLSAAVAVLLVFSAALFAGKVDEQKLLKLVPDGANLIVSADFSDWISLPAVKKFIAESRDITEFRKKSQIEPGDLGALLLWGDVEGVILLTAWNKPVEPGKLFPAPHFVCSKSTVSGIDFWNVSTVKPVTLKNKRRRKARNVSFCLTVLPGNVIAFFQDPAAASEKVKLMKKGGSVKFPAAAAGSLRGVLRNAQPPMPEQALLSCSMTGRERADLEGFVSVTMTSAEEAAQMCGQGMLMTNILLAGAMQNDPQLAAEIVQNMKFGASGKDVTLKFKLPAELLARIGGFVSQEAKAEKSSRRKKTKRSVDYGPYQEKTPAAAQ